MPALIAGADPIPGMVLPLLYHYCCCYCCHYYYYQCYRHYYHCYCLLLLLLCGTSQCAGCRCAPPLSPGPSCCPSPRPSPRLSSRPVLQAPLLMERRQAQSQATAGRLRSVPAQEPLWSGTPRQQAKMVFERVLRWEWWRATTGRP